MTALQAESKAATRFAASIDWLGRHPVVAIILLVAAQQVLTVGARDLWWSDEVRQADVLQSLIDQGHWIALQLNQTPYPDKPPLYFWFLGLIAAIFGSTAPPVIFFGLALTHLFFCLCVYAMGRMMAFERGTALVAVLVLSTLNYLLFLSHYARMDFMFAGFIALVWGFFWKAAHEPSPSRAMLLGFAAAAAATMTKGPFGFLLPLAALIAFLAWQRRPARLLSLDVGLGLVIIAATVAAWIAGIAMAESLDYVRFIFSDQIVGRTAKNADNPLNYLIYLGLLPLLFMPWTVALPALRKAWDPSAAQGAPDRRAFLWSAVVAGVVVMSVVGEKHDYYLLPLFAPLSLLVAMKLTAVSDAIAAHVWISVAAVLAVIAVLLPVVPFFLPYAISIPGVALSSAVLLGTAFAVAKLRTGGVKPAMSAIVAGQTVWVNVLVILILPSLDPVMSPRNLADAVASYVDAGYSPATYAMAGGDLAYHLPVPYREGFRDIAELRRWIETQDGAVVAMPVAAWTNTPPDGLGLREVARIGMAGDSIVIGISSDADCGAGCPARTNGVSRP